MFCGHAVAKCTDSLTVAVRLRTNASDRCFGQKLGRCKCIPRALKNSLTYSHMGMYYRVVARASTTSDAFNAVAEPRRREILSYLAGAERPVGDIVTALDMGQPAVSKHLRVLRDVGLVRMRCRGRQKLYRTNAEAIRPVHQWAATFERYWQHQLNRVKERAEAMARPEPNLKEKL
jgi:DNA-binding transcriptional ArsR family regulator